MADNIIASDPSSLLGADTDTNNNDVLSPQEIATDIDDNKEEEEKKEKVVTEPVNRPTTFVASRADSLDLSSHTADLAMLSSYEPLTGTQSTGKITKARTPYEQKMTWKGGMTSVDLESVENKRAQNQTFGTKALMAVPLFLGKTFTNVVGGTVGIVNGGGAIFKGTVDGDEETKAQLSNFYLNDFNRMLDTWNEKLDSKLPFYYEEGAREQSLAKQMGTANFWTEQLANGMSFLAGAVLTEFAWGAASTTGIGFAGLAANTLRLQKMLGRSKKLLKSQKAGTAITQTNPALAKFKNRVGGALTLTRRMITGAGYEASVEARHNYDHIKKDLIAQQQAENIANGLNPELTDKQKKEIEDFTRGKSNGVFGGNLLLVGMGNMLMFPKLYGPGVSQLRQAVRVQKGAKGAESTVKAKWVARKEFLMSKFGISDRAAELMVKTSGMAKATLGVGLYEGMIEEAGQATLDKGYYDYARATYGRKGKATTTEYFKHIINGMRQTWGDPDGQVEIALGVILGMLGVPGHNGNITATHGRVKDLIANRKLGEKIQKYAADPNNKQMMPSLKAYFEMLSTQSNIRSAQEELLADGNFSQAKDLDFDDYFAFVLAKYATGQFEDIKIQSDDIRNMSLDAFKEGLGYSGNSNLTDAELELRKSKVADSADRRALQIKNAIEAADEILGGVTMGMDPDDIGNVKHHLAHVIASSDNIDEREEALVNKIAKNTKSKVVVSKDKTKDARYRVTITDPRSGEDKTYDLGEIDSPSIKELYNINKQILKEDTSKKEDDKILSPEKRAEVEEEQKTLQRIINSMGNDIDFADLSSEESKFFEDFSLSNWLKDDIRGIEKAKEVIQDLKDLRRLRNRRHQFIQEYNRIAFGGKGSIQSFLDNISRLQSEEEEDQLENEILTGKAKSLFMAYKDKARYKVKGKWYRFDKNGTLYEDSKDDSKTRDVVNPSILNTISDTDVETDGKVEAINALKAINRLRNQNIDEIKKLEQSIEDIHKKLKKLLSRQNKIEKTGQIMLIVEDLQKEIDKLENTIAEIEVTKIDLLEQNEYLSKIFSQFWNPDTNQFELKNSNNEIYKIGLESILEGINQGLDKQTVDANLNPINNRRAAVEAKIAEFTKAIEKFSLENEPIVNTLAEQLDSLHSIKTQLEETLFKRLKEDMSAGLYKNMIGSATNGDEFFHNQIDRIKKKIQELQQKPEGEKDTDPKMIEAIKAFNALIEKIESGEIENLADYIKYADQNSNPFGQKAVNDRQVSNILNMLGFSNLNTVLGMLNASTVDGKRFSDRDYNATIEEMNMFQDILDGIQSEGTQLQQDAAQIGMINVNSRYAQAIENILKAMEGIEKFIEKKDPPPRPPKDPLPPHKNPEQNNDPVITDDDYNAKPDIVNVGLKKSAGNFDAAYKSYFETKRDLEDKDLSAKRRKELTLKLQYAKDQLDFFEALNTQEVIDELKSGEAKLYLSVASNILPETSKEIIYFYNNKLYKEKDLPKGYYSQPNEKMDIKISIVRKDPEADLVYMSIHDSSTAETGFTNLTGADIASIVSEYNSFRDNIINEDKGEEGVQIKFTGLSTPISLKKNPFTGEPLTPKNAKGRAFPSTINSKDVDLRVATSGSIVGPTGSALKVDPGFKYIVDNKGAVTELTSSTLSVENVDVIVDMIKYYLKNPNVRSVNPLINSMINHGTRTKKHRHSLYRGTQGQNIGYFYQSTENNQTVDGGFISLNDLENNSEKINAFKIWLMSRPHNIDNGRLQKKQSTYRHVTEVFENTPVADWKYTDYANYTEYLIDTGAVLALASLDEGGPIAPRTSPRYLTYDVASVETTKKEKEDFEVITVGEQGIKPEDQEQIDLENEFEDFPNSILNTKTNAQYIILDNRYTFEKERPVINRPVSEIEEEIARGQKMLKANKIQLVSGFIQGNHKGIVGQVRGFGNTLISNLGIGGEVYHEVFHQISLYTIPESRSSEIYDEFRELFESRGSMKTYQGKSKRPSEFTDKEVEEHMAEEFREWVMSEGTYNTVWYGTFKKEPKTFFGKMFAKIKAILQGLLGLDNKLQPSPRAALMAELFQQIESGYYADYQGDPNRNNNVIANVQLPGLSNERSLEATESVTAYFSKILFFDKKTKLDISDIKALVTEKEKYDFAKKVERAYDRTFLLIERDLRRQLSQANQAGDTKSISEITRDISYFQTNKEEITTAHKLFLSGIGLEFSLEYDDIAYEKDRPKDSYGIFSGTRANEFSATTIAKPEIKLLIGTLPNTGSLNSFRLVSAVNPKEAMDFLHSRLEGIVDIETQFNTLKNLAASRPWIKELVNRLGELNTEDLDVSGLQTSFYSQFSQSKTNAYTTIIDQGGADSFITEANQRQESQRIKDRWISNLRLNKTGLVEIKEGALTLNLNSPLVGKKSINDLKKELDSLDVVKSIEILKALNITFTSENEMVNPRNKIQNKTIPQLVTEATINLLDRLQEGNIVDLFNRDLLDIQSRLNKLVLAESKFSNNPTELMYTGADNKRRYSISQNSIFHVISNSMSKLGLLPPHLDPVNNPYTTNSLTIQNFLKNGFSNIEVAHLLGQSTTESGEQGSAFTKLDYAERKRIEVNNILRGITPSLQTGDNSIKYAFLFGNKVFESFKDAETALYGYLEDEIRTSARRNAEGFGQYIELYKDQVKDLRVFKNIMNKAIMSDELTSNLAKAVQGQYSLEDLKQNHYEEIIDIIHKSFKDSVKETSRDWISNRIVDEFPNIYRLNGLGKHVTKFAKGEVKTTTNKGIQYKDQVTLLQLEEIIMAYLVNDFVGTQEQFKVFFGDPAQYKKSDVFKRYKIVAGMKGFARNDVFINKTLNLEKNRRRDGKLETGVIDMKVFAEPISESIHYQDMVSILGQNAADYLNMQEADAHVLGSLHAYRNFLKRTSTGFSKAQETLYQKIYNNEQVSEENFNATFPTIKPHYAGPQMVDGAPNLMALIKLSLTPLIPTVMSSRNAENLQALEKNMEETGTDFVAFPSAFKLGGVVNEEGNFDPFYSSGNLFDLDASTRGRINKINPGSYNSLDVSYFGVQLEISQYEKTKNTAGIQPRALVLSNIYDSGQATNTELAQAAEEYNDLLRGFTKQEFDSVVKNLGITLNNDGTYTMKATKEVVEYLHRQMMQSNFSENVLRGVEKILSQPDVENRVFDILPNKEDVESLFMSIVTNKVITQKFKGDLKVLQSPIGYERGPRILKADNKLVSGFYSSEGTPTPILKSYRIDPSTGNLLPAQILVPHYFKEYGMQNMKLRADGIYDDANKKVSNDVSLLKFIGYRIPTGGLNLIDVFEVAGFLPKAAGPIMVIPAELTIKESLDFDIDKQNLFYPSYRITTGGNLIRREYIKFDPSLSEAQNLEVFYIQKYQHTINLHDALEAQIGAIRGQRFIDKADTADLNVPQKYLNNLTAVERLMTAMFGEESLDYYEDEIEVLANKFKFLNNRKLVEPGFDDFAEVVEDQRDYVIATWENLQKKVKEIPTLKEYIEQNKGKSAEELNHKGAVQNRIMDLMEFMVLHKQNNSQFLRDTGPEEIIAIANELVPAESASNKSWDNIFSSENKTSMLDQFIGSKDGLGIAATNNTHIVKSQIAGLALNVPSGEFVNFENFPGSSTVSISRVKDIDGDFITEKSNRILNALADATKDPAVFRLGITPETLGAVYVLLRAGVPFGSVKNGQVVNPVIPAFFTQPIILEYNKLLQANRAQSLRSKRQSLSRYAVEQKIRNKYFNNDKSSSVYKNIKELLSVIQYDKYGENTEFSLRDNLNDYSQQQILSDYLRYKKVGDELLELTNATAFDSARPRNRQEARLVIETLKQNVNNPLFINANKLITDTYLSEQYKVIDAMTKMFSSLFLTESPNIRQVSGLNYITSLFSNPNLNYSEEERGKILKRAENDLVVAGLNSQMIEDIYNDNNLFRQTLSDRAKSLMFGENSLPKIIAELQKSTDNKLLQGLVPIIKVNVNEPDNLKYFTKSVNSFDRNVLLESFNILPDDLQNKLIEFAILQSGFNKSDISFLDMIPVDKYVEKAKSIIPVFRSVVSDSKAETPVFLTNFVHNFFKNNWKNKKIVPKVKSLSHLQNVILSDDPKNKTNLDEFHYFNLNDQLLLLDKVNKKVIAVDPKGDSKSFLEYQPEVKESLIESNNNTAQKNQEKKQQDIADLAESIGFDVETKDQEKAKIDKNLEENCD